jgi:nucleotide-binding universal stress UspA family protein
MARPVLFCFDGSEDAGDAIRGSGNVLEKGPAVVAHAWRPLLAGAFRYGPEVELTETLREAVEEADEAGATSAEAITQQGVKLANEAGFRPVEGKSVAAPHSIWAGLVDTARELDARVIVLGARGRSRIKHALLGSISAAVSYHADRPVLLVRV